jgi:RNA polymerase sigma-70 factor (ECF subfamily)
MSGGPTRAEWEAGDDDTLLLERARDGQTEAFGTVYRRHNRVVLAYLARRVAEPELAANLLAETFAALLVLVRDEVRAVPSSPVAWLLGTARHLLIDSYRRGRVEARARTRLAMQPLSLDDGDLRRIEEISAETDILAELARTLPPDQLAALRARVLDEHEYAEIARDLRCSEAVVRKRVSRAIRTLRAVAPGVESGA